jgi:valyl-tRNA synthetase
MNMTKRYNPNDIEPELGASWRQAGTYNFDLNDDALVFSIDTPPPTVSGKLHLGHLYSYSHPDFIARFWRMNGYNVFYPMGFDDNGLPTGRLVEIHLGIRSTQMDREDFIQKCLQISEEAEKEYQEIWERLGLSIDWRYTYRTMDHNSRQISQLSFIKLYQQDRVYRMESPTIWCPECGTAIAQAELDDINRESDFVNLNFNLLPSGDAASDRCDTIRIATTRPELLPACVAIFVHPEDERHNSLVGRQVEVPIFGQQVQILADLLTDPQKGTGIVMCCTFGDHTDIAWWQGHKLSLIEAIGPDGRMTANAGLLAGLKISDARKQIKELLRNQGFLISEKAVTQSIRIHERCDTPVEYITTYQWFIRILNDKNALLDAGDEVNWYPPYMANRYQAWVENLKWDWCISRQRYYGIAFPVWYCQDCGDTILADEDQLPVNPTKDLPNNPCPGCGNTTFQPEMDVMDTWATSSMTPQIVGSWIDNPKLYNKVFPFTMRAQAHDIIRTWAFYTIVKSHFHYKTVPWDDALISGWGIAAEGQGKISKSRKSGTIPPMEMIKQYSADAVRYWAASTGPGKDAVISVEKIQNGSKLITKIWNVARFSSRFIEGYQPIGVPSRTELSPADKWILSRTQVLVQQATSHFKNYDYAASKAETEALFWNLTDNYLEMVKQRLYDQKSPLHGGAKFTLYHVLLTLLKLFAPIMPHITEHIYQGIFVNGKNTTEKKMFTSIHKTSWPEPIEALIDQNAEKVGDLLVDIATRVRRYKSENNLSLGTELSRVKLTVGEIWLVNQLNSSVQDLKSITRAEFLDVHEATNFSKESTTPNWDFKIEISS